MVSLGADPMLLEGEGLEPGEQAEVQAWAAALEEDSAALQARQSSHLEASCSEGRSRAEKLTSLTIEALRSTVTAFFHAMPKACANCGAEVPDLKRSACSPTVASLGVSKAPGLAWQGHSQLLPKYSRHGFLLCSWCPCAKDCHVAGRQYTMAIFLRQTSQARTTC